MIYLDNAATAKPYQEAMEAVLRGSLEAYANPSSLHRPGQKAANELEAAREGIAGFLGIKAQEALFSPSGTYSSNAAILGFCRNFDKEGAHFITSEIEHASVLECFHQLENEGYEVSYAKPDGSGFISPESVEGLLRPTTKLVSVMAANNEVGTIEPIDQIAKAAHSVGAVFHTDAAAAFGKTPINTENIDMLSASSHKIYGPKGIGLLYIKSAVKLKGPFYGGKQERGAFPGTASPCLATGFAKALELYSKEAAAKEASIRALASIFRGEILKGLPFASANGPKDEERSIAGFVSLSFESVMADRLLAALDASGVACSLGAACSAGSLEPSHVIEALRPGYGISTLRFTFGKDNTLEEAKEAAGIVCSVASRLYEKAKR